MNRHPKRSKNHMWRSKTGYNYFSRDPVSKPILCFVLLQVPKWFVLVQNFWASPKIWVHLVPLQKLLCRDKNQFYWMQIIFLSGTKCLWLPQYVNKFLVWHKRCGPAQNILGPVKGQGISILAASNRSTALPYPSVLGFWKIKFDKLDF